MKGERRWGTMPDMGENQATDAVADVAAGVGDKCDDTAPPPDSIQYCSEHRPANAAALASGGGICALCLQEKLGLLVSSSKASPFFPLGGHSPPSGSLSPASLRRAGEPPASALPFQPSSGASRKKTPSSLSTTAASAGGGGYKRSKSVAPKRELEQFPSSAAEGPRKKGFWSFLSLNSFSAYAHQAATAGRRKSVSVAWASMGTGGGAQDQQPRGGTSSTLGRTLEAIGVHGSPSQSQVSSSSSFGRKVARSLSVGCGSRSFSGERLSDGFGDFTLRSVESHREPKLHKMRGSFRHLGGSGAGAGAGGDGDVYEHHQHRIKCAGFFGILGPASSSYRLSAAEGASVGNGTKRSVGRSHRSWS